MVTIVKKTEGTVNVLAEREWLFKLQKARVNEMVEAEAKMPKFDPQFRRQIEREKRLLSHLNDRLTELYFALGTLTKAPKTTKITNDGATTMIESEGRDHIMLGLKKSEELDKAVEAFYAVLNALPQEEHLH